MTWAKQLTGLMFSMPISEYQISRLRREDLPALFEGRTQRLPVQPQDLATLLSQAADVELWGIWASHAGYDSFLPHLLLGRRNAIEDAYAWSSTFMRGVGPLSALIRTLQIGNFTEIVNDISKRTFANREILANHVGIIAGEILARIGGQGGSIRSLLPVYTSTLAFSLFRARGLFPGADLADLANRWRTVRGVENGLGQSRVDELILALCETSTGADGSPKRQKPLSSLFNLGGKLAEISADPNRLRHELRSAFPGTVLTSFLDRSGDATAEQLVRAADELLPQLASASPPPEEKALAIAYVATLAVSGFSSQAALVASYLRTFPEVGVWLGALQSAIPPLAVLSAGDGVGWRVALELDKPFDLFSRPECDIDFHELSVLSKSSKLVLQPSSSIGRLSIELHPGVTTVIRLAPDQNRWPGGMNVPDTDQNETQSAPEEILDAIERSLQSAMSAIRRFKRGRNSARRAGVR
jgi:hypothetical protein